MMINEQRAMAVLGLQQDVERHARRAGLGEGLIGMSRQDRMRSMVLGIVDDLVEAYGAAMADDEDRFAGALAETLLTVLRAGGLSGLDMGELAEAHLRAHEESCRLEIGGGIRGGLV